ncbi:hypothetical protein Esti_000504 [Eimeria stiedai]
MGATFAAGYPTELKLYLLQASLILPKGRDILEPSKVTTAEENIGILRTVLDDPDLLSSLASEAQRACADLKAFACGDIFKSLDCKSVELQILRQMLSRIDMQVGSPQGAQPDCIKAMRKGLMLFDLVAIATPFVAFQTNRTKGEQAAVSTLFSSLNIRSSTPRSKSDAATLKEGSESTGSTRDVSTSLLELVASKRGKGKTPKELAAEMLPVAGAISKALATFPEAYLAFAGTGGPLASLIINWFYQVTARSDEFFGPSHSSRRPLAPLGALLTEGHELRMARLYQMCGIALGNRRKASRLPPNNLFVPRESFTRTNKMGGIPRLSCDLMTQALLAMHLAEMNVIERLNSAQRLLPPEKLEHALPLELNAGGVTNFQRLCSSFRAQRNANLFENLSCSLEDTLLLNLEAKAEGGTSQATKLSFAETSPAKKESGSKESEEISRENAQLSFSLVDLRAGNHRAAGTLLNADAGSCIFTHIYPFRQDYTCKTPLKGLGETGEDISGDGLQCSMNWKNDTWDKKLHCPKRLLSMQCAASRGIHEIYEGGMRGSTEDFLLFLAKEAACGEGEATCSEELMSRQSPFKVIARDAAFFNKGLQFVPAGENMLRVFVLLSGNTWKNVKDILSGNDGIEVMFRNFSTLMAERKTSLLLSRWLPHTIVKLVKQRMAKKYSKRHLQTLLSKLPADFFLQLRNCVDVVVHPLAFLQLNQLSFTRSDIGGARSSAGGLSQKLDGMLGEAATKGLPQRLKEKLQSGASLTKKDYRGINFAHVEVPKVNTWQDYVKAEVSDHLAQWMLHPENDERLQYECSGGTPSNILAAVKDSMELLSSAEAESLTLIGKVVSPKETSLGKTGFFKRVLKKMLRLPPYKAQHQSFVAVKIDILEALKAIRTLTDIYMQHKDDFENQHVFVNAALDLFAHYEKKYSSPSRELLGVPENALVPALHPNYTSLPQSERLREMKDSAMSEFFRHIWTLMFSVAANNMLNAAHVDKLEKTFTKDAWSKSINDPFQASSFGVILMGSDIGLQLFNQMLPSNQRKMLMRAKYGSASVFTSQTQLTGSLLSASGHAGLGMFLHAQSVYFGVMIKKWIDKRASDRIREILSWLTLGLFFATSFIQTLDGVTEMAITGNETGQVSMGGGCPPMGLCMGDKGNVFITDPTGSPPLTALQVILKTGVMASFAVFAGPVIAVYNIAVSNFEILSRLEMALGNAVQRIIQRISKSKVVKDIKKIFKSKEVVEDDEKKATMSTSSKRAGLGDEVDAQVSAFVQIQQPRLCKRC